ncbi:hypothetical protein AAW12_04970 [Sphingobacterium sp. Ag1]|uniref:SMEK domain-containing protein n=1 Tax=Sphingobacterium sp. Ag1 TaxID=1643451 RepID=UPI000627577D|nr:SMEK domain-containing protein [Sphingobacterium sp. Ag1]KKO92456.1 hypothetical protein AAW12_04970 [Sphingobacterium sp. Ag1]
MTTKDYLEETRSILAYLSLRIKLDNINGYTDFNKYSEILLKSIFSHIYSCEFKQFEKINHPAIDIYSLDHKVAIQISSESSTKKIKKCLSDFIINEFHLKYEKLYIIFLTQQSSVNQSSLDKIVNNETFNSILVKACIFNKENVLDFNQLYKLIENLPQEDLKKIHQCLKDSVPTWLAHKEPLKIRIPSHPQNDRYIQRHLTSIDYKDYWGQYFEKKTLITIANEKIERLEPIRILIKANAGQGKTSELDHIANQIQLVKRHLIPLRINLKNYTNNLNSFIKEKYGFWDKLDDKSEILLLIDGLDEIPATIQRNFISEYNHLIESNEKIQIISTIRTNFESSFYTSNNGFSEYYINPLYENDIILYIEKYSQQSNVLKTLVNKSWAKSIISIPFYLQEMVTLSNDSEKKLPKNLKDFYNKIITSRIERDYIKYNGYLEKNEIFLGIQKAAIFMTLQGLNSIKFGKLKNLISFNKENYRSNPFFSIHEDDLEMNISFIHNNFQEFLSAQWLAQLEWKNISNILFNKKLGYLNPKLLNTTVILFSILDGKSEVYQSLLSQIKSMDFTILLKLEKERIPLPERLQIFKDYVYKGKHEGIAYLAGDFSEQTLLGFIDYDTEIFDFIMEELNECNISSNHFHSLLYLILELAKIRLTKGKSSYMFTIIQKYILQKGYKEDEYQIMLKIVDEINLFDQFFLNNIAKRCPSINNRVILTTIIKLIDKHEIPNQFEYIISKAEHLIKDSSNRVLDHKRIFSKYIIKNLEIDNYKHLLTRLSIEENFFLVSLFSEKEHFDYPRLTFFDQIYIRLAELYKQNKNSEVINDFILYINEIYYSYNSNDRYGDPLIFFKNLGRADLLNLLLTSNPFLKNGYIINKLFDLELKDQSNEIINLYKANLIDFPRLKSIYLNTCSASSATSLTLSKFMSSKFPKKFTVIKSLNDLQSRQKKWLQNGLNALKNRKEFIKQIEEVIHYIINDNPQIIDDKGFVNFDYRYREHLDEIFENSILIDTIESEAQYHNIDIFPFLFSEDRNWYTMLGNQIILRKYHDSHDLLMELKSHLQNYVDLILTSTNFTKSYELELAPDSIDVQIAKWFKESIIELPFDVSIQLLCHPAIDFHTNDGIRMNDFLIKLNSFETIKPYLIDIISNRTAHNYSILLGIKYCIDYEVIEVKEEIIEILFSKETYLNAICSEYLIKFNCNDTLLKYLMGNPNITEDWQLNILNFLHNNELNHRFLIEIVENQQIFENDLDYYNYIPKSICRNGLKLGSRKCMLLIFQSFKNKRFNDNLHYSDFDKVELLYPNEIFTLCLDTLEIYKDHIEDHGRSTVCGILDNIIATIAADDVEKFQKTIKFYDNLIEENLSSHPNIKSLEWWKIRLTKRFEERNSNFLSEKEALELIV